jgi:DNA polymerase-3 subunit epsilon
MKLAEMLAPGLRAAPEDAPGDLRVALEASGALLVIDFEMSGANPLQHEILEAGCVRVLLSDGLPEVSSWGDRVRPLHIGNAEPAALKVVNYSPKGWRQAIDLDAAVARLAEIGAGAVVAGWGIGNDLRFLAEILRRTGRSWPFAPVALDIQPIARGVLKRGVDVDYYNLGHVADRLGIGRMGEHSALADAYAAYDVLTALVTRMTLPEGAPSAAP